MSYRFEQIARELQRIRSDERIARINAETRRKNEKNRHRRPVKPKPLDIDAIDFSLL